MASLARLEARAPKVQLARSVPQDRRDQLDPMASMAETETQERLEMMDLWYETLIKRTFQL